MVTTAQPSMLERPIRYLPRPLTATQQDSLPGRYSIAVQVLSMAAFSLAFLGWLNEAWLKYFDNPFWLNRYTEYAVILVFGLWRIRAEVNPYTRRRLLILVTCVSVLWWGAPVLAHFAESYVGYPWRTPVFPSLHVPGTLTFFLVLVAVLLFGRRVICGFNCPCVGIRETVGFAFRDRSVRGEWAWRLRHSKWFFFAYYVGVMIVTQYPPTPTSMSFVGGFYAMVAVTYFGSFFIAPLVGNRFYCRYLCPYGATFGLLNHAGFYGIQLDADKCNDCRRCEQVCDMGIPVWEQGKAHGRVTGIEDCMGCARCVVSCPTDALEIRDVRNLFKPSLAQNASHLLKRAPQVETPRHEPEARPAVERRNDWQEIYQRASLVQIVEQSSRCLDCGVPGCRNACPLSNRIPDWLKAAARGDIIAAAEIAHKTSPLPEVCGRLCPQQRLCEGGCTLAPDGNAVTIGAIERAITDHALAQGWQPAAPVKRRHESVAVIGAGPAGLACAERLARAGVAVCVYDREQKIGGLLASGVPSFKFEPAVLDRRESALRALGIEFVLGVEVDAARIRVLRARHDAVFIGTGAQRPRVVNLPGQHLAGVHEGLAFLRAVKTGEIDLIMTTTEFLTDGGLRGGRKDSPSLTVSPRRALPEQAELTLTGRHVLVLGGGDTAMDCVRSAQRLGAEATVVYRGTETQLRASKREAKAAREEGAKFVFEHRPLIIEGDAQVHGVRFATADSKQLIHCDLVILAFGFVADPPAWLAAIEVETDAQGRIRIDAHGRTSQPKIFAGGDNTHGPDLVVTALAAGRRAAEAILTEHGIAHASPTPMHRHSGVTASQLAV